MIVRAIVGDSDRLLLIDSEGDRDSDAEWSPVNVVVMVGVSVPVHSCDFVTELERVRDSCLVTLSVAENEGDSELVRVSEIIGDSDAVCVVVPEALRSCDNVPTESVRDRVFEAERDSETSCEIVRDVVKECEIVDERDKDSSLLREIDNDILELGVTVSELLTERDAERSSVMDSVELIDSVSESSFESCWVAVGLLGLAVCVVSLLGDWEPVIVAGSLGDAETMYVSECKIRAEIRWG